LEFGHTPNDVLLVETAKAAIQYRADFPTQSEPALLQHPREFQRLLLLAPISRDCFILRVLLGINVGTCSRILRLGIEEFREALYAALQELPRLEAHSAGL
jgi:DNA-directed RNA polymerase specialized sigma24 family protein